MCSDLKEALTTYDIKQYRISSLTIQAFIDMQIDPMTQKQISNNNSQKAISSPSLSQPD